MPMKGFIRYTGLSELPFVKAVRSGLIMIMPITMIGSFALILNSLPVVAYQNFMAGFLGGVLPDLIVLIHNATFGMMSIYMTIAIAYCYAQGKRGSGNYIIGMPIVSLASFVMMVGTFSEGFSLSSFGARGMFSAIIASTACANLYYVFDKKLRLNINLYSDGISVEFNSSLTILLPALLVIFLVGVVNQGITGIFHVSGFQELFVVGINSIFQHLGSTIWSGILFIFSINLMWFFGIHGTNMLEIVSRGQFEPALDINAAAVAAGIPATEILTKTFFDCFALIGGCGSTLSLLLAILLFSRRRDNTSLAKYAMLPMVFNINEIMVFGLPIIFNPILFIPFLLTPLVTFFTSYFAMAAGLVPLTVTAVEWTTPVLLSGYLSTGSISGVILQVCNVAIGVMIYQPFVRMLDRVKLENAKHQMDELVGVLKQSEETQMPVILTGLSGNVGMLAKSLTHDIRHAISCNEMQLYYQPQFDEKMKCFGAEALLRWRHPVFEMIYPPLIIKLAHEAALLTQLEEAIFSTAAEDFSRIQHESGTHVSLCVNLSPATLREASLMPLLSKLVTAYQIPKDRFCIEVTEQMTMMMNPETEAVFQQMKDLGLQIGIDDFSMGFTSIKYLQSNQFDLLKLDGNLVKSMNENSRCKDIIDSVLHLAKSLKFEVLAECVETEEQLRELEKLGCLRYQGYLFSPAVPLEDYIALLKRQDGRAAEEAKGGN